MQQITSNLLSTWQFWWQTGEKLTKQVQRTFSMCKIRHSKAPIWLVVPRGRWGRDRWQQKEPLAPQPGQARVLPPLPTTPTASPQQRAPACFIWRCILGFLVQWGIVPNTDNPPKVIFLYTSAAYSIYISVDCACSLCERSWSNLHTFCPLIKL